MTLIFPHSRASKKPRANQSRFKELGSAQEMHDVVGKYVFPFMQAKAVNSTHAQHMKDARLTIPTAALLQKAVDGLDAIPMEDRDTKGDVYEYMLSKIATAGENGQFRTPSHIIGLAARGNYEGRNSAKSEGSPDESVHEVPFSRGIGRTESAVGGVTQTERGRPAGRPLVSYVGNGYPPEPAPCSLNTYKPPLRSLP
jgi:hypothetical protein